MPWVVIEILRPSKATASSYSPINRSPPFRRELHGCCMIRTVVYGITNKTVGKSFPRFDIPLRGFPHQCTAAIAWMAVCPGRMRIDFFDPLVLRRWVPLLPREASVLTVLGIIVAIPGASIGAWTPCWPVCGGCPNALSTYATTIFQ